MHPPPASAIDVSTLKSELLLAVAEVTDSKVTPGHLLPVSREFVLVSRPFLVVHLALSAALLALGDADESVDDDDKEDDAADATANGDLGGVREAGPLLLGLLGCGELVQLLVGCGFATGEGWLVML